MDNELPLDAAVGHVAARFGPVALPRDRIPLHLLGVEDVDPVAVFASLDSSEDDLGVK